MRMDGTGCLYSFHLGRPWVGYYPCCLDEGHEGEHKHLDDTWRKWTCRHDRSTWMSPEEREALPEVIAYRAFIEQMREDLRSPIKAVREEAWTRKFTPQNSAQFAGER